jgi:hypothetical protein
MTNETSTITTPSADYFAAPGLSNSGMKDLAVSPLRYWHLHVNPNRPAPRTSPEMTFGSALHCSILEPEKFYDRYSRDIDASDFAGCLSTMDDLRAWLKDKGLPSSGKTKAELVDRVASADPSVPILDVLRERHAIVTAGKTILSRWDWDRVQRAADALLSEPALVELLSDGRAEVPMSVKDPETGVILKAKMDFVSPLRTVDLKTFAQKRGISIDQSVTSAIWHECYYRQGYTYGLIRSIAEGYGSPAKAPPFILPFIESEEPHEVRIRSITAKCGGEVNMLWERARIEVTELIRTYADCMERFGDKPWRDPRGVDPLEDMEFPGLAY